MHRAIPAIAALLFAAGASAALAAAGDGLARACVAASEARAEARGRTASPEYLNREALCACLQRRIQADDTIDDADKDTLTRIFTALITNREEARRLRLDLPQGVMRQMQAHAPACHREIIPRNSP